MPKWIRGLFSVLLALGLFCCNNYVGASVLAKETEVVITAMYLVKNRPVSGTIIRLYHVADTDGKGGVTWLEPFARYNIAIDTGSTDSLQSATSLLESYVLRDTVSSDQTKATNSSGEAIFRHLAPGIYLISGGSFRNGHYTYHMQPSLVFLPYANTDGTLCYDVPLELKTDEVHQPGGPSDPSTTTRKVVKKWRVSDNEAIPDSVEVQLLKDGELYETVELNAKNGWSYAWHSLSKDAVWRVVEADVPGGYEVSIDRSGSTFTITNTSIHHPPEPEPPAPQRPQEPESETPPQPEPPSKPSPQQPETPPSGPKLPQTGFLRWRVLGLSVIGCGFVLLGLSKKRRDHEKEAD